MVVVQIRPVRAKATMSASSAVLRSILQVSLFLDRLTRSPVAIGMCQVLGVVSKWMNWSNAPLARQSRSVRTPYTWWLA